jgi:hypothetical protein
MKKKYMMPEMLVIEMKLQVMLCLSGNMGGNASEPALAPEMDADQDLLW